MRGASGNDPQKPLIGRIGRLPEATRERIVEVFLTLGRRAPAVGALRSQLRSWRSAGDLDDLPVTLLVQLDTFLACDEHHDPTGKASEPENCTERESMGEHERKIAENEAVFRHVNEIVEDTATGAGLGEQITFVCECGDEHCAQRIELTLDEYEQVRVVPTHFFVLPGHDIPELESIVERHTRYWVVEKQRGEGAEIATTTDPRASG